MDSGQPSVGRTYEYDDAAPTHSHGYILPRVETILAKLALPAGARALDFGCGNGSLTAWLADRGYHVVGVDPSASGVAIAKRAHPALAFSTDVSAENIARLGPFDIALSIEVIAHCFEPQAEVAKILAALKPGAPFILATPYHGYMKNVALALAGRLDGYLTGLYGARYTRLFSEPSIRQLLEEAGFEKIEVTRIGRIAPFAKTMIVVARKPA